MLKTIILKNGEKKIIGDNLIMLNVALSNLIIRRKKDILNLPVKNYHKLIFELNEYEEEYDLAHEALIEAIDDALLLDNGDYTPESWAPFATARTEAIAVRDDPGVRRLRV